MGAADAAKGVLGGAATGAALGTAVGGPVGTAIGAVAGGVIAGAAELYDYLTSQGVSDEEAAQIAQRASLLSASPIPYESAFKGAEKQTFGALSSSGMVGREQAALAEALRAQAEGRGPSLAQMQYKQALEQSQAAAASQLASARGLSPAQAQQMLMTQQAGARQAAAGQSAQLRLQEQMAAQAALGNLLGQRRQQELLGGQLAAGLYGAAGGLGMGQAQLQQQSKISAQSALMAEKQRQQQVAGAAAGAGATLIGSLSQNQKTTTQPVFSAPVMGDYSSTPSDGGMVAARGAEVPGKAKFKGDTRSNDTVPALLSPGEIVLPRSVAQSEDAPDKAKDFVSAIKKQKRPTMRSVAQAMSRLQELEARLDALEALSDLETEQEG